MSAPNRALETKIPAQYHRYAFPTSSAHTPILFTHFPVARIALIPGQFGLDFANFYESGILHCGAVNSSGHVVHYSQQYGLQKATSGWENCVVIRLTSTQCKGYLVSSSVWDKAIEVHYEDKERWSRENYVIRDSILNDYDSQDCLDFIVSVTRMALNDPSFNRIRITTWIANQLVHLDQCDNKR
ncbi:hypothetical protein FBUS_04537 [Fasciolopsis buskii]|uniref:MKRN2 opposite strand protein-like C-terminal domain-containing protein n=1 Tax=Fasciolopsis buskii TaxID=27845 RepID=A0A8E0VFP4_9TREM|nr:hypothetical protein FBUS_04537 [Fasciolopsis buski]